MVYMIVNNSGNVGKSFIARELLYSNFNEQEDNVIIEVETHNSSSSGYAGVETAKYKANQFKEIYSALNIYDNIALDIGASNIDNFLKELLKREEIKEEIDYFVVPVYSDTKQTKDSLKTLQILQTLEIDSSKIKVIFNRVRDSVKEDFATFLQNAKKLEVNVDETLRIFDFEVVEDLDKLKTTSRELLEDTTDYKAEAKRLAKEGKEVESRKASDKHLAKLMAKKLRENTKVVYKKIKGD
eukprot:TRINITY_DN5557_c0_g5_i1.p1 TRINITY_DN5557_c0_g5~~TRINITY_DN5557_c0_g5_i1.p1  ORF type:complete len:259 (-),score=34.30 TRINITY_DN5557_c0_g5_i1:1876-2598(-)